MTQITPRNFDNSDQVRFILDIDPKVSVKSYAGKNFVADERYGSNLIKNTDNSHFLAVFGYYNESNYRDKITLSLPNGFPLFLPSIQELGKKIRFWELEPNYDSALNSKEFSYILKRETLNEKLMNYIRYDIILNLGFSI